ncbi:PREDICTED: trichohyalin isoform X2 [Dinoponera quadriceps]|uniref:Trichohyalin isoform X2 n=1 Tax=Dinoponera quadriceps TaxID=609295 RepID=A0A6P3XIT0_DINQU|nr:PREDICTED: trichohyalin isoform X2 [Dinoponera quadriceps]
MSIVTSNVSPKFTSPGQRNCVGRSGRFVKRNSQGSSSTMDVKCKNEVYQMIMKDFLSFQDRHKEILNHLNENADYQRECLQNLLNQLLQPSSVPIVMKTPKVARKRGFQRIETILEDDVLEQENTLADDVQVVSEKANNTDSIAGSRIKRMASLKAVNNIAKQSLLGQNGRLRELSDNEHTVHLAKKGKRESQLKRKKSVRTSSDEDEGKAASKYSKLDENVKSKEPGERITRKVTEQVAHSDDDTAEKTKEEDVAQKPRRSLRSGSTKSQKEEKKDDAIISPTTDIVEESIYEDAIGKPTPIMNSTLKYSLALPEKILNATVILEPLPQQRKLNETVVIQKAANQQSRSRGNSGERTSSKKTRQGSTQSNKKRQNDLSNAYNELITDDESSPELKKSKKQVGKKKRLIRNFSDDDDEVPNTPPIKKVKEYFKQPVAPSVMQEIKASFKPNALFSPYAKESVKKRVEAFEQAVMQSPASVDVNAPTRITRTKTRAMAAAEAEAEAKNTDKNYTQILARKSLAKAKKIACLVEKQKKDNEEFKESFLQNKEQVPEQNNKAIKNDRLNAMQKTTPLSKSKIIVPMSANRIQTPLNAYNLASAKALTASRVNIVTSVESFIQAPKTVKDSSADKLEDKRRHEEDALKKRKEALRLQTEEKRRKREEKELKNKLAREAKEKQELEKRLKAEREREEKAKLAQMMQEKQREEMEKKRLAQLQRAQEKEERRKLEEQQRLQRLHEQEEAERLLAEQKRREQEAEKRKEMEVRAQQQAEATRLKNMAHAAQTKHKQAANKQPGTTNYVLDSEPDDDDSDDESRPKHEIPYWAQAHVRKVQLAMQRHIPEEIVYKFFDTRKCTPDLTELFQGIDRSRLKRTSSAIWKTPPRFSTMSGD